MNAAEPPDQSQLPVQSPEPEPSPRGLRELGNMLEAQAEVIGQLRQQLLAQRTLLMGLLLGAVVLSASVNVMTIKQMRLAREQLNELRPRVLRMYTDFRQHREPAVKAFIGQLQAFAETNQSFQPVLERFRSALPQYLTGLAVPPPVLAPTQPAAPAARPGTN